VDVCLYFCYRIGTEHEKFGFEVDTLRPIKYDQIRDILNGLAERFDWDKIMEENNVIGLKQVLSHCSFSLLYEYDLWTMQSSTSN
jgi:gamma-glutamylcysteine synthetase